MQKPRMKTRSLALVAGLCAIAISAGLQVQPASAQDSSAAATAAKPQTASKAIYYVDFRARTAASYGHAFVWYGRSDQKQIEVAGLHPAGDVVPYMLGHLIPVIAETGKSYGDLDEQYLTASYRVYMTEAQAQDVFAYIKRLQAISPVWNAATWNCVAFIQAIASHMGLRVPVNHLLYPEDWVNQLRQLNGGRKYVPGASSQPMAQAPAAQKPAAAAAQKPAAAAARKPATPPASQVVEANPRT
jgi:pyruvate/2-oxoglutarate dehydrogenase complex dihydrolipoamide acyltransferase (E2) component